MASLRDDLTKQRFDHEEELNQRTSELQPSVPENITEPAPVETLSLEEQVKIAQTKMEAAINKKYEPKYSSIKESYSVKTPYGNAIMYSMGFDDYYTDMANAMLESDKIGRRFLKEKGIKTADKNLAQEISNYYACQSVASYIEQEKDNMSPKEYKTAIEDIRFQIFDNLKVLNKKGFSVNPETGELDKTKTNAVLLAQQQSR